MLAALQRKLFFILTAGLLLTLVVVADTCHATLGYDRLNDQENTRSERGIEHHSSADVP